MRVPTKGATIRAPGQAGKHTVELAGSQLLPVETVFGDDAIASDLCEHHAQREHVSGLVKSSCQGFRCEIMAVALAVDMLGRRPRASQAEVGNLESTLEVDEDVCWLQV